MLYWDHVSKHNAFDAEVEIFWDNYVNAMAVDALAPCIIRPSAAIVLTVYEQEIPDTLFC